MIYFKIGCTNQKLLMKKAGNRTTLCCAVNYNKWFTVMDGIKFEFNDVI